MKRTASRKLLFHAVFGNSGKEYAWNDNPLLGNTEMVQASISFCAKLLFFILSVFCTNRGLVKMTSTKVEMHVCLFSLS